MFTAIKLFFAGKKWIVDLIAVLCIVSLTFYISVLKNKNDELLVETGKLKAEVNSAIEDKLSVEGQMTKLLEDLDDERENRAELQSNLMKTERSYEKRISTLKKRSTSRLEKIVAAKPGMFESRARAATQRLWMAFETVSSRSKTTDPVRSDSSNTTK